MKLLLLSSILCSLNSCVTAQLQKPIAPFDRAQPKGSGQAPPPYRDKLLSLHRSLVEIESITGNENNVGNFIVDYLASRHYTASLQRLPSATPGPQRFNVLAWPGAAHHPSPRLLVTSHIDVVPPYIPYKIDAAPDEITEKTVIHGRGSVDAKASVAAQITALQELLSSGEVNEEDVVLAYVVGEEVSGDGMRYFSESLAQFKPPLQFEAAIFGEPTQNRLACGHKGHMQCRVTAKGKAGHSGYPWLGKSANELLVRAMVGMLDRDLGSSERFGNTTVNVGVLEGGVAGNVIAESATALLAIRVATGPQLTGQEIVREGMEKVLKKVDSESLSIACDNGYGAVKCDCDVDGFKNIIVNYGTDIPNLSGNHTRYLYGPGDILVAHSDHEALTVGDLETAVEGYKSLIKHVLARPTP